MKRREGANSAFSAEPSRPKSKSCEELRSTTACRTLLASPRTGETKLPGLRVVKSFAVLSLRERSSGNSEAKIAHNTTLTRAMPNVLTILIRGRDILLQSLPYLYTLERSNTSHKLVTAIHWIHLPALFRRLSLVSACSTNRLHAHILGISLVVANDSFL